MSRRKHVLQSVLQQHADPPGPGQHIVRAVGSRGSNIIEARPQWLYCGRWSHS